MNNAEAQSFQTELAASMDIALQSAPFSSISEKTRKTLAEILYAFKEQQNKVKLTLVTLNGLAEGVVGEESLLGLEMQAQQAIKAKLMIK